MTEHYDVAVVGAGMAGASLAAELAPHARVVMLEAEDRPGYHTTALGRVLGRMLRRDGHRPADRRLRAVLTRERVSFPARRALHRARRGRGGARRVRRALRSDGIELTASAATRWPR
jgi:flavin-dependent dehydrogenase